LIIAKIGLQCDGYAQLNMMEHTFILKL